MSSEQEEIPPFRIGDLVEQVDDFYPERQYWIFVTLDSGEKVHDRWRYRVFVLHSTEPEICGKVVVFHFTPRHLEEECLILSSL